MKKSLLLVLGLMGVLLATVECSGDQGAATDKQVQVKITIDEFMKDKHIARDTDVGEGGTLTLTLGSNPTTGFQWTEQAEIGDEAILRQTGHRFISPEEKGGTPSPPGTAGKQEWTFTALKKGSTEVSMEYSRPWEGGEKGEWTFNLSVVVK